MKLNLTIPEKAEELMVLDIHNFSKRTGLSPRSVGRRAIGDNDLMKRLAEGGTVTLPTLVRLYRFMREYE